MPEPTRTINPEHAASLYEDGVICEETNPTAGPWTYIATQNLGSRRWNSDHRMILRHADGTHWGISYVLGLTEEQPHELPWSCADTPLPLTQVWPHQITHTVYFAYDHLPARLQADGPARA